MGLLDRFKKKSPLEDLSFEEERASSIKGKNEVKLNRNNYKNVFVKAVSFIKGEDDKREYLSSPEYNLKEIEIAAETDSYIKMAIMKYSYMLFKAGYRLHSENEEAAKYVATRFYIMSFATGKPTDVLFQEIGDDLIKFSNAFIVKSRVPYIMPGVNARGFYAKDPVGGYFRIDPSTVSIERDKHGTIKKYYQKVQGQEKSFQPSEVIHFYLDKEAANAFGTPRIVAALDDVKMLRRIEANVMALIHRFSMPIYQWKIGLAQDGYQATNKEIEDARWEIEGQPLDGCVVTNEKTEIKAVGAEGNALDASSYLNYFEKRVFSGLGVSETQMGRGATGSNADSMESQAHDTVKYIQKKFATFLETYVINELLLEGGFNPIVNPDDRVYFIFNEISLDTKIKLENHMLTQYQSNVITLEEMRREVNRKEDVDEERLYQHLIIDESEARNAEVTADASIRVAQAQAKVTNAVNGSGIKGANPKGNGTSKDKTPNKASSNKNTPTNQHGKTSVKIKESAEIKKHKRKYENIYNKYYEICNDIMNDPKQINVVLPVGYNALLELFKQELAVCSMSGITNATEDIENMLDAKVLYPGNSVSLSAMIQETEITLKNLCNDLKRRIRKNDDVESAFDTLEYRLRFMLNYILPKAYWYSYLKTGESLGFRKAHVDFGDSKDVEKYNGEIDIKNLDINKIPPFHSFCTCEIEFRKDDLK